MNAMMVNLPLAIFWLSLGVYLFVFEYIHGMPLRYRPGGINPGWLAILFGVFNCYRVYWNWSYRRQRDRLHAEDEEFRRRFERRHKSEPRPEGPPDPNFIFTDPPPARSEADSPGIRAADPNRPPHPGNGTPV